MATHARTITTLATFALLGGCDRINDTIDDVTPKSEATGRVVDNRGEPVAGVTVRLFDLADNTNFVEGGDLASAAAFIDKGAVLDSDNSVASGQTDEDGTFSIDDVPPTALLAVARIDTCSAGFAGFDEETGILDLGTLIKPEVDGKDLSFDVPDFVVACATPPAVGPDGNSDEAPPFEPPPPVITCNADDCAAAGGSCDGDACVITCAAASCAESGGTCVAGVCELPLCNATACEAAGGTCEADACVTPTCVVADCEAARGTCSGDGNSCDIPACWGAEADCTAAGGACSADGGTCDLPLCSSDADCAAGQPGSYCVNPGDVATAECLPPDPGELVPPDMAIGWTGLRVTDSAGNLVADASAGNQVIAAGPADGLVRIEASYSGAATTAFLHVQSGGQSCPNLPPRTDSFPVEIANGGLASTAGAFVEIALHGGYEKIMLSTSPVVGEGEQSYAVEIGTPCAPPAVPFTAILSWEAGPGNPADLDINVWNGAGDLVFVGKKDAAWGQLALEGKGPGPEVFEATDVSQGPFTIKVQFFSGKPRDLEAKLRVIRTVGGQLVDDSYTFVVTKPKDVAEIGVFTAE